MSGDRSDAVAKTAREPARRNPALVKENILDVATAEFADKGFTAASVNEIAAKTHTTKRMLYYYFTNKEGLYTAVLEREYGQLRDLERAADTAHLDPVAALRTIAELTFDYHDSHRDFVRLVNGENMLRGKYIRESPELKGLGTPALTLLTRITKRGQDEGLFRPEIEPIDIHMLINSLSLFRITNHYTFDALFGRPLAADELRSHFRTMIGDVTVRYACVDNADAAS